MSKYMMHDQLIFWILLLVTTNLFSTPSNGQKHWLKPVTSEDLYIFGQEAMINEDRWADSIIPNITELATDPKCLSLKPTNRDIINRFTSVLPYFDRSDNDREKVLFLDKLRHSIIAMTNSDDAMNREVAFYATVLIPLVFLQEYRDIWCLLERFYRAIRLFSSSHPTNKKSGIKLLQNLRPINQKVKSFVTELPVYEVSQMSTASLTTDSPSQKKDIKYLKELFKSLG